MGFISQNSKDPGGSFQRESADQVKNEFNRIKRELHRQVISEIDLSAIGTMDDEAFALKC